MSFGIGTFLTNDFYTVSSGGAEKSKALNIVIKLSSVDEKPCVKISDDLTKVRGPIFFSTRSTTSLFVKNRTLAIYPPLSMSSGCLACPYDGSRPTLAWFLLYVLFVHNIRFSVPRTIHLY